MMDKTGLVILLLLGKYTIINNILLITCVNIFDRLLQTLTDAFSECFLRF